MPGFIRTFLFGDSGFRLAKGAIGAKLVMGAHTEGWAGIPHGGIGMGAIVELASVLFKSSGTGEFAFPFSVQYRLGGASVRTGKVLDISVSLEGRTATATAMAGNSAPYISAVLKTDSEQEQRDVFNSFLPADIASAREKFLELPYYRNCFVCGVERNHPGLKRRLKCLETTRGKLAAATAGFDPDDDETFFRFQRDGVVHPLSLIALLDETMGWAGFLAYGSGAVTVRAGYTFYRNIGAGEKIVFFARGEKVKGSTASRMMFWTSGGAAVVDETGKSEVVAACSGQYLAVPELTQQMKTELIPPDLTERAFRLAEGK